jgi:SRSO17 transposase
MTRVARNLSQTPFCTPIHSHKHRMLDDRMQCMPGDEVWLVGERRSTGEQKYYVSNLPADATLKMLAAAIKARWICEQAHQQLKEELGLDHFEGR